MKRVALAAWMAAAAASAPAAEPSTFDPRVQQAVAQISAERIEQRIRKLAAFGTRHTLSETQSETRGIGAARRWIAAELEACSKANGGRLQVSMESFVEPAGARMPAPHELVNVVAVLPGTSPASKDRLLVVSGHYDSRNTDVMDATGEAPGANDDASGTAAVMELACAMAGQSYDATLVFMAVPGEEQGLLGAAQWAREAARKDLNVEAMITNDIIGSAHGDKGEHQPRLVRLFAEGMDPLARDYLAPRKDARATPEEQAGVEANYKKLRQLLQAGAVRDLPTDELGRHIKSAGERYVRGFTVELIQRRDRYLRGGDHIPFLERGFAAVRMSEPVENFDHQHQNLRTENGRVYGDLPEFVDFAYVADVARVNAAALGALAVAPAAPREVRLEAVELTNDTTLSWQPSSDPAVVGYRIVWRSPGSPAWQHSRDVGKVAQARLPVSKDNVIFGVQALGASGEASLASYPLPLRK
ncbi:M28 family peptidase [Burkholderiaceae bacterium UC74_6]